jgi:hypothetical protein
MHDVNKNRIVILALLHSGASKSTPRDRDSYISPFVLVCYRLAVSRVLSATKPTEETVHYIVL